METLLDYGFGETNSIRIDLYCSFLYVLQGFVHVQYMSEREVMSKKTTKLILSCSIPKRQPRGSADTDSVLAPLLEVATRLTLASSSKSVQKGLTQYEYGRMKPPLCYVLPSSGKLADKTS